jgi:peptide methionine sulfoxide reductase msrA/msrB
MSRKNYYMAIVGLLLTAGYAFMRSESHPAANASMPVSGESVDTAIFAGGCFWCMEPPFEKLPGVLIVESGYTGGRTKNPTYEQVSHTETGHVEAVRVTFDKSRIRYDDLLNVFWRNVDPTDSGGQFVDRGTSYLSAIFVDGKEQRSAAQRSLLALERSKRFDKPIMTSIREAATFYLAEAYHQDYYKKNPIRYKYYRYRSGRDQFLDSVWGTDREVNISDIRQTAISESVGRSRVYSKPPDHELRARLTPLQYSVTQAEGTERPFDNEFWDNSREAFTSMSSPASHCSVRTTSSNREQVGRRSLVHWKSRTLLKKSPVDYSRREPRFVPYMATPIWDTFLMTDLRQPDSATASTQPR